MCEKGLKHLIKSLKTSPTEPYQSTVLHGYWIASTHLLKWDKKSLVFFSNTSFPVTLQRLNALVSCYLQEILYEFDRVPYALFNLCRNKQTFVTLRRIHLLQNPLGKA